MFSSLIVSGLFIRIIESLWLLLSCSVKSMMKFYSERKGYILYSDMISPFTINNSCFCPPWRNRFKDFKILNGHQHSEITYKQNRSACTLKDLTMAIENIVWTIFFSGKQQKQVMSDLKQNQWMLCRWLIENVMAWL